MEALTRKPYQGVSNIVLFNWHFYLIAFFLVLFAACSLPLLPFAWKVLSVALITGSVLSLLISLSVSHYIYDRSSLYTLQWLDHLQIGPGAQLVNIHAGFDETSAILTHKFPGTTLTVYDFYDPAKHTEVSIERARKVYAVYPGTKTIDTSNVPLQEKSADCIFLIFAAHEIRNPEERVAFFRQLKNCLADNGKIIVVEHLRDPVNFFAYNIGFFHFFSKSSWFNTFESAGLHLSEERKMTPFISVFILQKNGTAS